MIGPEVGNGPRDNFGGCDDSSVFFICVNSGLFLVVFI